MKFMSRHHQNATRLKCEMMLSSQEKKRRKKEFRIGERAFLACAQLSIVLVNEISVASEAFISPAVIIDADDEKMCEFMTKSLMKLIL